MLRKLLQWANSTIQGAAEEYPDLTSPSTLNNLTTDIMDSVPYIWLLHALFPTTCTLEALKVENELERAGKPPAPLCAPSLYISVNLRKNA